MVNVSEDYIAVRSEPVHQLSVKGTISGGMLNDPINFTAENILSDTFKITNRCHDGKDLVLGSTYIGELDCIFVGLEISDWRDVVISVQVGMLVNDEYEWVNAGVYFLAEAKNVQRGVEIVAYDALSKFDVDVFDEDGDSAYVHKGDEKSVYDWVKLCCDQCHISLATSEYDIEEMCTTDIWKLSILRGIATYRDLLHFILEVNALFCFANGNGALEVREYLSADVPPDDVIDYDRRFMDSSFSNYEVIYRGVRYTNPKTKRVYKYEASLGNGYLIDLGSNPFLYRATKAETKALMRDLVDNSIIGLNYVPFRITISSGMEYQLGDILRMTNGTAGSSSNSCVMSYVFQLNKGVTLECVGSNPALSGGESKEARMIEDIEESEDIPSGAAIKYYVFINDREYNIGQGDNKQLIGLTFGTVDGGYVVFQCEIHAECNGKIDFSYYINDVLMDWKPHDVYDGAKREHIISLMMPINTSANTIYDFELWAHCIDGSAKIKVRDLRAIIWGQGLAATDEWNGRIRVEDEFSRLQLGGVTVESFSENVGLNTAVPIRAEVNESMSKVVPIQRVSIYNNVQEAIYFNRRFAENYTWEEFELNTWQEAEDNFLWD